MCGFVIECPSWVAMAHCKCVMIGVMIDWIDQSRVTVCYLLLN